MNEATCSVEGCDKAARKRGWCLTCYGRWWEHGDPAYVRPPLEPRGKCVIPGCEEMIHVKKHGWCRAHYNCWWHYGDPLREALKRPDLPIFFETLVDSSGGPDACHPWLRTPTTYGYGRLKVDKISRPAHVLAWELAHGERVPTGFEVDHECHNQALREGACRPGLCPHRLCCNPRHLVARSRAEHLSSAVTPRPKGSGVTSAKLTETDIPNIRRAFLEGKTLRAIAGERNVNAVTITAVLTGETWQHV